jgi:hypothetical protein
MIHPERGRVAGEIGPFPIVRAAELAVGQAGPKWLIDGLWAADGVGVIGGAPKCCKTWLALELAVAVASGTDALGRFPVMTPGPVLAYAAEDAPAPLHHRLLALSAARGLPLGRLDLFLLTTPALRLDTVLDRTRLSATLDRLRPRLLLLDPLVRLHRADENSAADMAALLGELRDLQRRYALAIMLVHHLRKQAGASIGGQGLRGSGDLHAWGDSNLYLRRRERELTLSVEHRSAPAPDPFRLVLAADPVPHLAIVQTRDAPEPRAIDQLAQRILDLLAQRPDGLTREQLRDELRVRNATLGDALVRLRAQHLIERDADGFRLRLPLPVPVPPSTQPPGTERPRGSETAGPQNP